MENWGLGEDIEGRVNLTSFVILIFTVPNFMLFLNSNLNILMTVPYVYPDEQVV